ncbi:hypothetical protein GCG21_08765 [Pseudactinotalea sp. HY160]|uniref:hypothetical protein n=1 Tax=Pseudactinotalea sp. HY160 TaxID=2654490 RepID=UPI00128C97B4|nr:hypothetical protein [Pseudactinotalea sp. HY160]MPV50096.1 hypothetical protein [Pseudactinotalea sp. HY160]
MTTDLAAIRARAEAATSSGGDLQELAEDTLALLAEVERMREEAELYRTAICFETTCTNCARLLDRMVGLDEEVDRLTRMSEGMQTAWERALELNRQLVAENVDLRIERDDLAAKIDLLGPSTKAVLAAILVEQREMRAAQPAPKETR